MQKSCTTPYFEILPKIEWLGIESLSMKRIFHVDDYSNLCSLGFASIQFERFEQIINVEIHFEL